MNGKLVALVLGLGTILFGVGALVAPQVIMSYAGFAVASTASFAQASGEVRAIFGGLFVVLGTWILVAALRGWRLVLAVCGSLLLGAAGGRLVGVYVEGTPGVGGWVGLLIETVFGAGLLWSAWVVGHRDELWELPPAVGTVSAPPPSSVANSPNVGQPPGTAAGAGSPPG